MNDHSITKVDAIWQALREQASQQRGKKIAHLFDTEPGRFDRLSVRVGDFILDASKNLISEESQSSLMELARVSRVEAYRDSMMRGDAINTTESRPVLHTTLRDSSARAVLVDNVDVKPWIENQRHRLGKFCESVRSGRYRSVSGAVFTDVINVGIGGSAAGAVLSLEALKPFVDGPRVHEVSNIDGCQLADVLDRVKAETTLVIVTSKSFGTLETIRNAQSIRGWLSASLGLEKAINHMIAVTATPHTARSFGIPTDNLFPMRDWVGGRNSIWSSAGMALCLGIGAKNFTSFLDGANAMDRHFLSAPLDENMPILLAMVGIWHRNMMDYASHVICPYDYRLSGLSGYLQQLDMESNGKNVRKGGAQTRYSTAPVIWGGTGTNAQHSFFQSLHQGTDIAPVDFIVGAQPVYGGDVLPAAENHHRRLLANCLAQSMCLMNGNCAVGADKSEDVSGSEQSVHNVLPGSRPSNTIMYRRLDPYTLGSLIALYEHKTVVQGVVWDVNSFDQPGVEKGKQLADQLAVMMRAGEISDDCDPSTQGLLRYWYEMRSDMTPI